MSDIYLEPTPDGGELIIENGKPRMTSGLENAVYLSLFTAPYWGILSQVGVRNTALQYPRL